VPSRAALSTSDDAARAAAERTTFVIGFGTGTIHSHEEIHMRQQTPGTGTRLTKTIRIDPTRTPEPSLDTRVTRMDIQPASTEVERSAHDPSGPEARHERIAKAAYLRAEARGFAPGHDLEDWLAAEATLDD
jgi:hypothetical protein